MFGSTTIPVLEQVVQFAQARHGLLAGNVANIDTPGYRAADLSPELFEKRLQSAIEARDRPRSLQDYGTGDGSYDELRQLGGSLPSILFHDDSQVSLEHQVAEIGKNQATHNLALTILTAQFRQLETAISERVV